MIYFPNTILKRYTYTKQGKGVYGETITDYEYTDDIQVDLQHTTNNEVAQSYGVELSDLYEAYLDTKTPLNNTDKLKDNKGQNYEIIGAVQKFNHVHNHKKAYLKIQRTCITPEKIRTKTIIETRQATLGQDITIEVKVTSPQNKPDGKIKITLTKGEKKMTYEGELTDGKANITIPADDLEVGVYDVATTYEGTNIYQESSTTSTLTVDNKIKPVLLLETKTNEVYKEKNNPIKVTLKTNDGEPLANQQLKLLINHNGNDETITLTTNTEGIATTNYTYFEVGEYLVSVQYDGTPTYEATTTEALSINCTLRPTTLTVTPSKSSIYLGQSIEYTVTLTGDELYDLSMGVEEIIIQIGSQTIKEYIEIDSESGGCKGIITITPKDTTPTSIQFTYETDPLDEHTLFAPSTTTVPIEVKPKVATTLFLEGFSGTAYNEKPVPYTLTLKDKDNQPISGQTITIKINDGTQDHTLTKTTDTNGTINDTYTFNTEGTYTITIEYKGTEKYTGSTTTTTQTVTKITTGTTAGNTEVYLGTDAVIPVTVTATDGSTPTGNVTLTINKQA